MEREARRRDDGGSDDEGALEWHAAGIGRRTPLFRALFNNLTCWLLMCTEMSRRCGLCCAWRSHHAEAPRLCSSHPQVPSRRRRPRLKPRGRPRRRVLRGAAARAALPPAWRPALRWTLSG
jgi:hypothetical protein